MTTTLSFPIASRTSGASNPTESDFAIKAGTNAATKNADLHVSLASDTNGRRYVNFATLTVCNFPGGTGCTGNDFSRSLLLFGTPTAFGEIPLSGAASYSGLFHAPATNGNDVADGTIGLTVNFASRDVTGFLTGVGIAVDAGFNGAIAKVPDFTLSGRLANNGLLEGMVTPGAGSSFDGGSWAANFFGPNAAEIGGTLLLVGGKDAVDPYFTGTFSAVKQ